MSPRWGLEEKYLLPGYKHVAPLGLNAPVPYHVSRSVPIHRDPRQVGTSLDTGRGLECGYTVIQTIIRAICDIRLIRDSDK